MGIIASTRFATSFLTFGTGTETSAVFVAPVFTCLALHDTVDHFEVLSMAVDPI
jgi:hypothetical protein